VRFVYQLIGRIVVLIVRRRFGRRIRMAVGVGFAVAAVAAYLFATRDVEEG